MRKKNLNITRNKQEKTVVLRIQRHDKKLHESFAISKFDGSWTAAEDAARARRDILLPTLPARNSGKGRVTRRNTSGVVGVSLGTRSVIQKNGETHTYSRWIAKWPGCSKPGGMPWSLRTFGEDDAFVLAALSRELESTNRQQVLAKLESIKGEKPYETILSKRKAKAAAIVKQKAKLAK